jgi:hypothetical protein
MERPADRGNVTEKMIERGTAEQMPASGPAHRRATDFIGVADLV